MLLFAWAGSVAAGPLRLEKCLASTDAPQIRIRQGNGTIVIKGWEKPEIHFIWTSSTASSQLALDQFPYDGPVERVRFLTEAGERPISIGRAAADLTIEAPFGSSAEIFNPQGSVLLRSVRGEVFVDTAEASISVMEGAKHLSVRSVTGDILLMRTSGRIEATSVSGRIRVIYPAGLQVMANTVASDIMYEGDLQANAEYRLSSYSGNIEVACPRSASVELRAKTVHGRILTDSRLAQERRHAVSPSRSERDSFLGTHQAASATLEVRSFSGTINIRTEK